MKRLILLVLVVGCGGALAKIDDDAGVTPPNKDGGPKPDASPPPPPPFDAEPPPIDATVDVGPPCQLTMCGNDCVDTSSDPNNCGTCFNVCTSGSCVGSTCTTSAPPQGTCDHSLCDDSTLLQAGCDPVGCSTSICAVDPYCCDTAWDSICVSEVVTYCAGYSCP